MTVGRCYVVFLSLSVSLVIWGLGGQRVFGAAVQAVSPLSHPTRYALLIGISRYRVLPTLPGAHNDVDLMRNVLSSQHGFAPDHVRVLLDEAATRSGIMNALQEVIGQARPQDTVFIHYSGHGSQIQDFNGDETDDHLDETLVPYDGRTEGIPDILDDELEALLSQLQAHLSLVILDSCHSGTATRGQEFQTRTIPPDSRLFLYRHLGRFHRGEKPPLPQSYVLMTGASAHERTLDVNIGGRYYGLFSYALFQSLRSISPTATAGQLFWKARRGLLTLTKSLDRRLVPTPQLEVPLSQFHTPLFPQNVDGGVEPRTSGSFDSAMRMVVDPSGPSRVVFKSAQPFDAPPGSVWALYSPGTLTVSPKNVLAYAIVSPSDGQEILGKVYPIKTAIPAGTFAVMVEAAPIFQTVPVLFRGISEPAQQHFAAQIREEMGGVDVVDSRVSQFVFEILNDVVHIHGTSEGEGLAVSGSFPSRNVLQYGLGFLWERELGVADFLALTNPFTRINFSVRVVGGISSQLDVPSERPSFFIMQEGASRLPSNSLQLAVQTDRDGYLTIVDVDQGGTIRVLFPNVYQDSEFFPDGLVHGNQPVLLPDSLLLPNKAGFHWDIVGPTGTDTIKVFFTPDRLIAHKFRELVRFEGGSPAFMPALDTSASFNLPHVSVEAGISSIGGSDQQLDTALNASMGLYDPALFPQHSSLDWTTQSLRLVVLD